MRSAKRITPNGGKLMVTLGEGAMLLILNNLTLELCRTAGDFHRFYIKPLLIFQIPN